jgi:dihydrofolate reductase
MITMIAAVSKNGILGVDGKIPWKYPADMKRFKVLTSGGTVIMGAKTWRSMGEKPLPNRTNMIIGSNCYPSDLNTTVHNRPQRAIICSQQWEPAKSIWIIGGASIYLQSMNLVDYIDLTIIPEYVQAEHTQDIVRFPWINPMDFELEDKQEGKSGLIHLTYKALNKIG